MHFEFGLFADFGEDASARIEIKKPSFCLCNDCYSKRMVAWMDLISFRQCGIRAPACPPVTVSRPNVPAVKCGFNNKRDLLAAIIRWKCE